MDNQSSDHLVLGGLLFLVFSLVVALVFVYTRAGDTETGQSPTTTATIQNQAPAVDEVNIAYADNDPHLAEPTGITLALGTTKTVVVWGVVSDQNGTVENGDGDLDSVKVVLRRSGATNADSCTLDNNDCYKATTGTDEQYPDVCTFSAGLSDTTKHFACTFALEFFADSTVTGGQYPAENWVANVTVTDLDAATGSGSATTEVNALLGLDVPTAIPYGQFALGATSTPDAVISGVGGTNVIHDLIQKGNVVANVEVQGSGTGEQAGGVMTCSALGTIPVGNQKWATSTPTAYANANALTSSSANAGLAITYQTDDNLISLAKGQLFWYIGIPTTGVRGTCTGQNTISVVAAQ